MFDAHPDGELAPRDVVARAIARQMEAQDGRPVYLDATTCARPRRAAASSRAASPTIDRAVRDRGLDWARDPIPVTPAAHYLMGGVTTDLVGRTTLPGSTPSARSRARACTARTAWRPTRCSRARCSAPGPATRCTDDAASGVWPASAHAPSPAAVSPSVDESAGPFTRAALQELMWEEAGLVRDARGLEHAASVIAAWRAHQSTPEAEADFENENLLLVAEQLVAAALRRRGPSERTTAATTPPMNAADAAAAVSVASGVA